MPTLNRSRLVAAAIASLATVQPAPLLAGESSETSPPGFTMHRTGSPDDFAYFEGGWKTLQHKRVSSGADVGKWQDFPATLCAQLRFAGAATIDEIYFPHSNSAGLTLRLFDPSTKQWSIFWANSQVGRLDPVPVVGGFEGNRGEFYAHDKINGRPVKVRYLWTLFDKDHARWEQALSYDDKAWDTNWTADFTRGDSAELCEGGRPKR